MSTQATRTPGSSVIEPRVRAAILEALDRPGGVVVITGAGFSVESGIRPYRGEGGRWTEDGMSAMSKATAAYFYRHPQESWAWHLDRRSEVRMAEPNAAHHSIARLAEMLGERFTLITQNIDRLHHRAGTADVRMVEIHGHLDGMRCSGHCDGIQPIPDQLDGWESGSDLTESHMEVLTCVRCGLVTRPHVLWFDEFYDEEHFGIQTAQAAVARAALCITVGTSGGVPIAERLATIATRAGAQLIDINPSRTRLRWLAEYTGGSVIEERATVAVPEIVAVVADWTTRSPGSRSDCGDDHAAPEPGRDERIHTRVEGSLK